MNHYGVKTVPGNMVTTNGSEKHVDIKIQVFDVKRPILSTGKLRGCGYTCVHAPGEQFIEMGGDGVEFTLATACRSSVSGRAGQRTLGMARTAGKKS